MKHKEIINYLIKVNNYKSYLEIGVYDGCNFNVIICEHKECCDTCECIKKPNCRVDYIMTSDEMFASMDSNKKYDIIFIDAMHDESFVDRDIMNSMKHLNENGVICLHDTFPPSEKAAKKYDTYSNTRGAWRGDVFKSILKLKQTDLDYYTINNDDCGLTIINYKSNFNTDLTKLVNKYEYNDIFVSATTATKLGKELLNIISVDDFIKKFN